MRRVLCKLKYVMEVCCSCGRSTYSLRRHVVRLHRLEIGPGVHGVSQHRLHIEGNGVLQARGDVTRCCNGRMWGHIGLVLGLQANR